MKPCVHLLLLLLLLGALIHRGDTMVHSLRYFHTYSSQVPNFPEFVSVGYLDDLQITHYNSHRKRYELKQEWMNKLTEEDSQNWDRVTHINLGNELTGKASIDIYKQRFEVTGGLHVYQWMFGCEWDDETNEIRGYDQRAFDKEDFLSFDFETGTYVTSKPQALTTKLKWKKIRADLLETNYIIYECAEYLKKFVRSGESALKRTVLPEVSLLQRASRAPVTCLATGFFPNRAMLFWAKDGDALELEDTGEILPNGDGTFQSSVSLDLSCVPPEDWDRYSCVFKLSGVKDDLITKVERDKIRTNERNPIAPIAAAILAVVIFVLCWSRKGNEDSHDVLRISLVGKTGCGKSSSGNTILGRQAFHANSSSTSITKRCRKEKSVVDRRSVAVVDTPGLFDTSLSNEEIMRETAKSIILLAPGPHAFLVVIQIGRFTAEEKHAVEYIKRAFGKDADKYIMILFTRGDDLKYDKKTIEDYIDQSDESLKKLVADCGNWYHVFDNRETDRTQVKELLKKIDNMVMINGRGHYTSEMLQKAEAAIQKETERIMKEKEEEIRREREKLEIKYKQEMEKIKQELEEENRQMMEQRTKKEEREWMERKKALERDLRESKRRCAEEEEQLFVKYIQIARRQAETSEGIIDKIMRALGDILLWVLEFVLSVVQSQFQVHLLDKRFFK